MKNIDISNRTCNEDQKDYQRITWNYIPERLRNYPLYQAWRSFILEDTNYFDFHLTITFMKRQYDDVIIKSTSHLLNRINAYLTSQRFRKTGRYIEGFAFLERHVKSIDKEGGLHVHILGCFSDGFNEKPSLTRLESKVHKAIQRVTNKHGNQMITPSGIDITEPYMEEGLVDYLSKQLTVENLDKRILFVGKDGLTGYEPDLDFSMRAYH